MVCYLNPWLTRVNYIDWSNPNLGLYWTSVRGSCCGWEDLVILAICLPDWGLTKNLSCILSDTYDCFFKQSNEGNLISFFLKRLLSSVIFRFARYFVLYRLKLTWLLCGKTALYPACNRSIAQSYFWSTCWCIVDKKLEVGCYCHLLAMKNKNSFKFPQNWYTQLVLPTVQVACSCTLLIVMWYVLLRLPRFLEVWWCHW